MKCFQHTYYIIERELNYRRLRKFFNTNILHTNIFNTKIFQTTVCVYYQQVGTCVALRFWTFLLFPFFLLDVQYLISGDGYAPPPMVGFVRVRQRFSSLSSSAQVWCDRVTNICNAWLLKPGTEWNGTDYSIPFLSRFFHLKPYCIFP